MRIILGLIIAATVVWFGYWFVVGQGLERSGRAWFAERQTEGWVAEYESLETTGFPYRFDTTLQSYTLADPSTGVVWTAPEFTITALAYRPNHIIALFPDRQVFASPFERLTVDSEDMRASVRFAPNTALALENTTAELAGVTVSSDAGWDVALEQGLFAIRRTDAATNAYDIFFDAGNLKPNEALRLGIDPQGRIPDVFEKLTLDAETTFTAPWDRFAVEQARPQPTRINLRDFDAKWGRLELRAVGSVDIDATGIPEGKITIKATNWREILTLAEATGAMPSSFLPLAETMLKALANASGPPNTIDVPLTFQRGRVTLGPLPLGPAPKLILR